MPQPGRYRRAARYRPSIAATDSHGGADRENDAARIVALSASVVAGGMLVASAFLPWSGSGAGSAISARELGDLALSGTVSAWVPRWLGAVAYLVPAAGALLLIGAGLGRRAGAAIGISALLLGGGVTVLAALALTGKADRGLGGGAMLAMAGAAVGLVSVVAGLRGWNRIRLHPDS